MSTVDYPSADTYLFIGQNGTPSNASTRYVVVKITSCFAQRYLLAVSCAMNNGALMSSIMMTSSLSLLPVVHEGA